MLFDKSEKIESKLKELTKDSTIPITKLKEFQRIYKEDSIAFYTNQTNTLNTANNVNTEAKINITQTNTLHLQHNPNKHRF